MRKIAHLFVEMLEDPMLFYSILPYIPSVLVTIFTIYIAIYVGKNHKGGTRNLIIIGAILQAVRSIGQFVISYIVIPRMSSSEFQNLATYYSMISLLGGIGALMFLYGIYLLLKDYFEVKKNHADDIEKAC